MTDTSRYWSKILISRRRMLAASATAGAAVGAAALVGCGGGGGEDGGGAASLGDPNAIRAAWQGEDETKDAVTGGVYRSTASELTGGYDPYTSTNFTTRGVADHVYEQFLGYKGGPGLNPEAELDLEGRLAESWEQTNDGMQATLKLRQNAKWHNIAPVNGRTFDIDDAKASLDRFFSVGLLKSAIADVIDKIEYPDNRTIVIKTKAPYGPLLKVLAGTSLSFYVMPKEAAGGPMNPATTVVGTGFKQLEKYEPAIKYTYAKNPAYWRTGKPLIDKFEYSIIPEYANSYAQFVGGNLHTFTPRPTDILLLRKDAPTAKIQRGVFVPSPPSLMFWGLKDFATAPWKDERVRQAIAMHFDREGFDAQFYTNQELVAAGIEDEVRWPTHIEGSRTGYWLNPAKGELGDVSRFWKLNLDEAVKLIDAAGYKDGFELTINWNNGGNYGAAYPTQVALTRDLFAKGGRIKVKDNPIVYQEWFNDYYNNGRNRPFSGLGMWGNNLPGAEIDTELYESWHSKAGLQWKGIADPRVDEMIEKQRIELDNKKRVTIINDFQKYMGQKMYAYPWRPDAGGFNFRADALRNTAWPSWNWYLKA